MVSVATEIVQPANKDMVIAGVTIYAAFIKFNGSISQKVLEDEGLE